MQALTRAAPRGRSGSNFLESIMRLLQAHGTPQLARLAPAAAVSPHTSSVCWQPRHMYSGSDRQRGSLRPVCQAAPNDGTAASENRSRPPPMQPNGSAVPESGQQHSTVPGSRQQHTAAQSASQAQQPARQPESRTKQADRRGRGRPHLQPLNQLKRSTGQSNGSASVESSQPSAASQVDAPGSDQQQHPPLAQPQSQPQQQQQQATPQQQAAQSKRPLPPQTPPRQQPQQQLQPQHKVKASQQPPQSQAQQQQTETHQKPPAVQTPQQVQPQPQPPQPSAPSGSAGQHLNGAPPGAVVQAADQGPAPLRDLLQERGIVLRSYSPGQYNHQSCPQCNGGNNNDRDLAVTISEDGQSAAWTCFRGSCRYEGGVVVGGSNSSSGAAQRASTKVTGGSRKSEGAAAYVAPQPKWQPLGAETLEFFRSRGISEATLQRTGIMEEHMRFGSDSPAGPAVAFPYYRGSRLVNIKYRALDKKFRQVKGAEKVLFGLNDIVGSPEIIIVEGEMDKLALEEAGYRNVVSVPDGATQKLKEGDLPPPDRDTKYSYLWNCRDCETQVQMCYCPASRPFRTNAGEIYGRSHVRLPVDCRGELDPAAKIVIATDNDGPGQVLAEELSRRLGRERCWRVRWPGGDPSGAAADPASDPAFRKDANHMLMEDGADSLRDCILSAEPYPIRGLFRFSDFYDEIKAYYGMQSTSDIAVSTGWKSVDEFYRVVPGELTIITGVPNSGKSEWIDALITNLTHHHGWSFALCSMEKKVTDHARQLLEKHIGVPFLTSGYAGATARMSPEQVEEGMQWLDDCFHLIRCQDDELPSIDWVLDLARAAVLRFGIRGLVIDPYNELDHQRPTPMSETEYVSQMLTKIKRFAQHHDVHVWFVAHPRQMRDWKGDPPNLYDISGSAHFINKCDNGIVVHRNNDPNKGPQSEVNILVRKVRNKAAGCIGNCYLTYDRKTGCYCDAEYQQNPTLVKEEDTVKQFN